MNIAVVSKSKFKPKALEYLRLVEHKKQPLIISHHGQPAVKVVPITKKSEIKDTLASLRHSVLKYVDPFKPVGETDWEASK